MAWRKTLGIWAGATLAALLVPQADTLACMGTRQADEGIPVRRWTPLTDPATPSVQKDIELGSLFAYLVPSGTRATLRTIGKASGAPLVVLSEDAVQGIAPRLRDRGDHPAPGSSPEPPRGMQWLYVQASNDGKSALRLTAPSGWTYGVTLLVVHRQAQPQGEPIPLDTAENGAVPSLDVHAPHDDLWLSFPGRVKDGWRLADGDTHYRIHLVKQLAVSYGGRPRVGVFLVAEDSARSGELEIMGGGNTTTPAKSYRLKINAWPIPRCSRMPEPI